MNQTNVYPIGTPGQKWEQQEKAMWLKKQSVKRTYKKEVLNKLEALKDEFDIQEYGALSYDEQRYPLFAIKSKNWKNSNPTVLITGGVHGYETSGVQGAIRFLETKALGYSENFNLVIIPCVSPWGYETINRWNPDAIDPNRSFVANSPAQESAALMSYIESLNISLIAHFDLHETTDTDNSEFRPALAARDGSTHDNWNIPDGFYLVGDTEKPKPLFQKAIIKAVEAVTHIAPADHNGQIIGAPLEQWGVINYATKALGLCAGFSDAEYCTTTEVYPDSPEADDENCILAQVTAITSGLDYIAAQGS